MRTSNLLTVAASEEDLLKIQAALKSTTRQPKDADSATVEFDNAGPETYGCGPWLDNQVSFFSDRPCIKALSDLSDTFPDAGFVLFMAIEGRQKVATVTFKQGEETINEHDWNSDTGRMFRYALGCEADQEDADAGNGRGHAAASIAA